MVWLLLHLLLIMSVVTVKYFAYYVLDTISFGYAVVAVIFSTIRFSIFGNLPLNYWSKTSWLVVRLLTVKLSASMYCAVTLLMSMESIVILVFKQLMMAGLVSVSTLALVAVILYMLLYEV